MGPTDNMNKSQVDGSAYTFVAERRTRCIKSMDAKDGYFDQDSLQRLVTSAGIHGSFSQFELSSVRSC